MKTKRLILAAALVVMPFLAKAGDDNFGTWAEIGIQKDLSLKWDMGLETEYRSQERDRWSIGANVGFKPIKYLKFGAAYNFLYSHRPEERKEKYKDDIELDENWNGFNLNEGYWSPRHRFSIDATGTVKLWKWLRISVRERYQFTHRATKHYTQEKNRFAKSYDEYDNLTYVLKPGYPEYEDETKPCESTNVLRSRLKLSYDKKKAKIQPFVSVEFHNSVAQGDKMNLQKIRSAVGMDYKINKQNEISIAYLLNCNIHDDGEDGYARLHERLHVFNIGYNLKF